MHALNWFEIPVIDFARAKAFYSSLFDYEMQESQMGEDLLGFLPADPMQGGVGGAIIKGTDYLPCDKGTVVYLNGGDDLQVILDRVESAGGKTVTPKLLISEEIGFFAFFLDTEGNKVALHSRT